MKISELIDRLEQYREVAGDVEVRGTWEGITTPINFLYIDTKGRLLIDNDQDVSMSEMYRRQQSLIASLSTPSTTPGME